jgi:glucosamine kinase
MSAIVVGVDGGGTQTRVVVADENGRELAQADGPGSAVRPGSAEASAQVITAAVREALERAGIGDTMPRVLCAGVAGTGRESERHALWQALVSQDLASDVVVHTDAAIALDDAFGDGAGILLVAGTGSIAYGRSPAGRTARAGGWGPVIGDDGSATWLAHRALGAVTAASDGREPETALTGALLSATECEDVHDLVAWAAHAARADFAALAPVVVRVAEQGDLRANSLCTLAVEELALHVRALARELFVDERAACPVALAGGLLAPRSFLRRKLEHRLKAMVPGAQVRHADVVPVRGAVRGALRLIGVEAG